MTPALSFRAVWPADLAALPPEQLWLWTGYLAPRVATLLTSFWKSGKTTLLAALLAQLGKGGQFIGQDLVAGKAVVVLEEDDQTWNNRRKYFDFGPHVCLVCRPFRSKPPPPVVRSRSLMELLQMPE
jgi:hypothetical protein